MHLFCTLQISSFQQTALFKCCCTFVMTKAFLFQIPKYMIIWKKGSPIVLGVFCTGCRQGEMHFHCSLRNRRHYASIVNAFPSRSTPCACTDLHSNTQCITAKFSAESVHHRGDKISCKKKSYPVHNHTYRYNCKTQPSIQTNE